MLRGKEISPDLLIIAVSLTVKLKRCYFSLSNDYMQLHACMVFSGLLMGV